MPRKKPKTWGDRFRDQVEPKQLVTLAVALCTVLGVRHEAGVRTGQADERVSATASLAVLANERADSLQAQVAWLARRLRRVEARTLGSGKPKPADSLIYGPEEMPAGWKPRRSGDGIVRFLRAITGRG